MSEIINPKHEAFCQAYARGPLAGNCAASYEAAGFAPDNANATRFAARPHIRKRIAELMAENAAADREAEEARRVERQAMLAELAKIAYANVADYLHVDEDGHLRIDLTQIDRDMGAGIKDVTIDYFPAVDGRPQQIKRVRLHMHDKRKALIDLCRLQGLIGPRRPDSIVVPQEEAPPPKPLTNPELEDYVVDLLGTLAWCEVDVNDIMQRGIADGKIKISQWAKPLRLHETITQAVERNRKIMYMPLEE